MVSWSHAGNTKLGKRIALVSAGCLLVAAGAAVVVATTNKTNSRQSLSDASNVLQSVSVKMAPDGDLTAIKGDVVGTTSKGHSFSSDATYNPKTTASDLPVRVLTSYRTAKKQGTDLSDLDGYNGKVDIQLTVQNLTAKARDLTYDVGGRKRTQSALVGVPLTVVASTSLDGVKPSAVTTSDDASGSSDATSTNGVLSQDAKGKTQVQWATILAPPQLGSSSTIRLALDAKDFQVPDFDISVQPGLVTDPSVGALIDAAFNPSNSSQYRLQQRTIALISDVNAVLARASSSLDTVSTTLSDSSKTLGTKTVSDLKGSTSSIAESVKGLQGRVGSLGKDLDGSLSQTKSTTLEELQQLVSSINGLLGDTSAGAPTPAVDANGCASTVALPKNTSSVYGQVLRVSSLLKGYSKATTFCKTQVQQELLDSVGPADPSDKVCADEAVADSVTCTLAGASKDISGELKKLQDSATAAVDALTENGIIDLTTLVVGKDATDTEPAYEGLEQKVDAVDAAAKDFGDKVLVGGKLNVDKTDLQDAYDTAQTGYQQVTQSLDSVSKTTKSLVDTNTALIAKICTLDPSTQSTLLPFVSDTDCKGNAIDADPNGPVPMSAELAKQGDATGNLSTALDKLGDDLGEVNKQIALLGTIDYPGLSQAYQNLQDALGASDDQLKQVVDQTNAVRGQYADAKAGVISAFETAEDTVSKAADLDQQIRTVTDRAAASSKELGDQFDASVSGLSSAAGQIQKDGKAVVQKQKGAFAAQQKSSSTKINATITQGLKQVDSGVTSSTRDLSGAQKLLTADLLNVLDDLGVRKVKGTGLLGAMATSLAITRSANARLSNATDTTSSYANVRQGDIAGILLQQAQADESRKLEAALPAFHLTLPASAQHRTVYSFHLGG